MAEKITQKLVDKLQVPKTGSTLIWDDAVRGFGLRVSGNGVKAFFLNYRINGIERRITIGRADEWTVTRARKRAEKLRTQVNDGLDPLAERERHREQADQERGAPTMADLSREYQEATEAYKRPHTRRDEKRMLESIVVPQLATRKVSEVSAEDLAKLHSSLKATPYQANRCLALCSAMMNFATRVKKWRSGENPAKGVQRFHEDRREFWLPAKQIESVMHALLQHPKRSAATALLLMIVTGCRKSELLSATWTEFDLERALWTRPSHHTKSKRTEVIPLSSRAIELLRSISRKSDYVFPGRQRGGHLADVKSVWTEVRTAAGIPHCRVHDLRHSFASNLVSSGESLHIVGKLLGHTQATTTQRYAHVADAALRQAANHFVEIIDGGKKAKTKARRQAAGK